MPRCKDCTGFGWGECKTAGENEVACKDFERKPKLTNAERIRQMTDEELAEFIVRHIIRGAIQANGIDDIELVKSIEHDTINSACGKKDIETALNMLRKEVSRNERSKIDRR